MILFLNNLFSKLRSFDQLFQLLSVNVIDVEFFDFASHQIYEIGTSEMKKEHTFIINNCKYYGTVLWMSYFLPSLSALALVNSLKSCIETKVLFLKGNKENYYSIRKCTISCSNYKRSSQFIDLIHQHECSQCVQGKIGRLILKTILNSEFKKNDRQQVLRRTFF